MEKTITLNEVIKMAVAGKDWTKKVTTRAYIPIGEKGNICRKYLLDFDLALHNLVDAVHIATFLELLWKFDVLMEYTNITVDKSDKTNENYDICTTHGIFDYIHRMCETDYVKMHEMVEKSSGIRNVNTVFDLLGNLNTENTLEGLKQMTEMLKDSKAIENVNKLLAYNNPALAEYVEANALREAKEKLFPNKK